MTPTPGERLEKVLRDGGDGDSIRWSAEVPIVTNPFILVDFFRFLIVTAAIIFAMAAIPQWAYTDDLSPPRLGAILNLCLLGCVVFSACLFVAGFAFLRNCFRATFVLNPRHIYYETVRGGGPRGLSKIRFFFGWRPEPVRENFEAGRSFAREIPWKKTDSFVSFPSVRTILLKRGIWEILKLYMPDDETHKKVEAYLSKRLKQRKP